MLRGILQELKRLAEALMGKWSLESWLDTIGEFTDDVISKTLREQSVSYLNGTCLVSVTSVKEVSAKIELFFVSAEKKVTKYEAKRIFPKSRFLSETLNRMEEEGEMTFDIFAPNS